MTRFFLLLLIALICAPCALAQNKDYSYYEFYVGYAHERANNNADRFDKGDRATFNGTAVDFASRREAYNGFNAEFNQNVTRHIGIVTSFTGTYATTKGRHRVCHGLRRRSGRACGRTSRRARGAGRLLADFL